MHGLYLEIPVDDIPSMEIVKRPHNTSRAESSCILIKSGPVKNITSKIKSSNITQPI